MIRVVYTPIAEKYFKKLKDAQLKQAFKEAITVIRENLGVGTLKTGDLNEIWSFDVYHKKTNYELAYRVGDLILIILAGTRENFYKELKRYMK